MKQQKIVRIPDEYTVVINAGTADKVSVGAEFEIYSPGASISDPDTNEPLGTLDVVKGKVKVVTVYPRMSVCKSSYYVSVLGMENISKMLSTPAELNVSSSEITGDFDGVDRKIHVGDLVRRVWDQSDT